MWPETAPIPPGWVAPIAPRQPDIPPSSTPHPVDRFIAAYFAKPRHRLPRPGFRCAICPPRLFRFWGLPPTPEQLEAFLHDRRTDKRARLIDALLADSKPYAENWISWWNDLLRNDPGSNYAGERKSITDWLLGALRK